MAVCAVSPAACDSARRSKRRAWTCLAVTALVKVPGSKQGGQVSAAHVFLRANVRKELKAGLCIQARCEKEGARAIVILTELGILERPSSAQPILGPLF